MKSTLDRCIEDLRKGGFKFGESTRMFKKRFLEWALAESINGRGRVNLCKTAKAIGVHRNTVTRLCEELGIDYHNIRKEPQP